jgi:hypothetical protein
MTAMDLPSWPVGVLAHGPVVLREFSELDVPTAIELSTDPYAQLIASLPPNASQQEAREWVDRQRGRLAQGAGRRRDMLLYASIRETASRYERHQKPWSAGLNRPGRLRG